MPPATKDPPWLSAFLRYTGPAFPPPHIPLLGLSLSLLLPYALTTRLLSPPPPLPSPAARAAYAVAVLPPVAALLISEIFLGGAARANTPAASAYPAAAAAAGRSPFAVVQANRVHQNHLESAACFVPGLLALAVYCDESAPYPLVLVKALALSWTAARVVYRVGYVSRVPFGRLVGTSMSLLPMVLAVGYPLYRFVLDL